MNRWWFIVFLLTSLTLPVWAQDADVPAPEPSGETYAIAIGEQVSRSLVASEDSTASTITYHTYVLPLGTSVNELTISVDGGSDDVDLVTQPSTPITRFADASYQGLDAATQHQFSYLNPPVGDIYIDVVNKTAAPVSYVLTVTAALPAQADAPTEAVDTEDTTVDTVVDTTVDTVTEEDTAESTPEASPETSPELEGAIDAETDAEADAEIGAEADTAADSATETPTETETDVPETSADAETMDTETADVVVDAVTDAGEAALPTGTYGALDVGESVTARIVSAADGNGLSYHTYIINVPEDISDVTISVSGRDGVSGEAANIDMVTNAGEIIRRFSEADFNGISPNSQERVSYVGAAGLEIYIDVVNRQTAVLEYTLSVTTGAEALFVVQDGVLSERRTPAEPALDTALDTAGVMIPSEPLPDGTYGVVPIGNTVTAMIAPAGAAGLTYNTYLVEVTEALDDLVLTVDVVNTADVPEDAVIHLVVQRGAIIESYDAADYNSFATEEARFVVASPSVGAIYYLDVVNLGGAALPYRLSVTSSGPMMTADRARDAAAANSADVVAPSRRSSIIDNLGLGQQAYGELQGKEDVATFHTYVIEVLPGTDVLELILQADQDLDLAAQAAAPIVDYTASSVRLANSLRSEETLRIDNPAEGIWYVDVINGLGSSVGSYTLEVR